ncbi:MAG: PepSY domain-containing protein [Parahaliea sp.]
MKSIFKPAVITAATIGLAGSLTAWADWDDARRLNDTKITLVKAIEIAEQHQSGRAYDASLDDDSFSPLYEVSLVAGDKLYEVEVDGVSGEVKNVREERGD